MAKKNIFKRVADSMVSAIGYLPVTKAEAKGRFNSISLNLMSRGMGKQNLDNIKKNGLTKPGSVSFRILRQLARHDAVIRICVNSIKKAVSQAEWEIIPRKNAPRGDDGYKPEIEKLSELFEFMNTNGENMRVLLDRIMEDLLVLDAGVIEKVYSLDGKQIVGLNSVDGSTIRPLYNEFGELGDPIAYYQFIDGKKVAEFRREDLVYIMANPQNDIDLFGYGMSPIESILLEVQAGLEATMYNLKKFGQDNVPPGILDLGEMTQDQAEEFIALWDATVVGNTNAMKFIWGKSGGNRWIPFNGSNKDMQYAEYIDWLTRIKLAAYGLSGIDANIFADVNRATGEVQERASKSKGLRSYKKLIEEYMTRQVIRELGDEFKYLEFHFVESEELTERKTNADIDKIYIDGGVVTSNEIRKMRYGLEPLPEPTFDEELDAKVRDAMGADKAPDEEDEKPKPKTPKKFNTSVY